MQTNKNSQKCVKARVSKLTPAYTVIYGRVRAIDEAKVTGAVTVADAVTTKAVLGGGG
jgi:hypothetical protein